MGASAIVAVNNMRRPDFDISLFVGVFIAGCLAFLAIILWKKWKGR